MNNTPDTEKLARKIVDICDGDDSGNVYKEIVSLLTSHTTHLKEKMKEVAWDYMVEATHKESWSRDELFAKLDEI